MTPDPATALAAALRSTAERWGKAAGNDAIDYLPHAEAWAVRILAALAPDWTLVPKADAPDVSDHDVLARAIHNGRIVVSKHGEFTGRCICNDLAASILRGMSGMVPKPSLDQMVAEFSPAPTRTMTTDRLSAALTEVGKSERWGQVPEGTTRTLKVEIDRLTRIEAAALPLVAVDPDDDVIPDEDWDPMFLTLRAALAGGSDD